MQQSFFQTETLSVLLNSAASHLGIPASGLQHLADRLSDEDAAKLNGELVDLLRHLPPTDIDFEEELPPPGGDTSKLSSRIWRQAKKDGQPTKMMFIRVKDAAPTVGIALVGFVIALVTLSPSAITSAMSTAKGVYDNFVKLKSPEDDDAMAVYDALLKRTARWTAGEAHGSASGATASEITQFGGPDEERAVKGLKRLKDLGLAEVTTWGGDGGDLAHVDNLWRLRA